MLRQSFRSMVVTSLIGAVLLVPSPAPAVNVNCNAGGSLQAKINAAAPGATIDVRGTCTGSFTINKNLTLRGNPSASLDANGAGRVLDISAAPNVRLVDLRIVDGAANSGGGISTDGGTLTLRNTIVRNNTATGTTALGGGIFAGVGTTLNIVNSTVNGNQASAVGAGVTTAAGGGIFTTGPLTVTKSTLNDNLAVSASGGSTATAVGGGIYNVSARTAIASSSFSSNRADASGTGATAVGGAVYSSDGMKTFDLVVTGSSFGANRATAAGTTSTATAVSGAVYGIADEVRLRSSRLTGSLLAASSSASSAVAVGAGLYGDANTASVSGSRITGGDATATGATSGTVVGVGIDLPGPATIRASKVSGNVGDANGGSSSATAVGGGVDAMADLTVSKSSLGRNRIDAESASSSATTVGGGVNARGGLDLRTSTVSRNTLIATAHGASSATAGGGGLRAMGASRIENSTIGNNAANAFGDPGSGSATAIGGAIWSSGSSMDIVSSTIARNTLTAVANTSTGVGGGVYQPSGVTLEATILALNTAPGGIGPNCFALASAGFNVLGSTAGCTFAAVASDKVNKNPKLGQLRNNGGPTQTMALRKGSPALNNIPKGACPVNRDQRGVKRPQGKRCDTGAYEATA